MIRYVEKKLNLVRLVNLSKFLSPNVFKKFKFSNNIISKILFRGFLFSLFFIFVDFNHKKPEANNTDWNQYSTFEKQLHY